ncbi:glycosyltransferase family 2 protein [Leptospira sp. GIMC2001]|uniref:glycosyltransferase family 2 protein n=1 Tax=Leptospira sp. GIMC2001 TaxID=1513297 RepID=UPI00234B0AE8|nr:glycosyltransferase family 2 protein [Leptospira sp. GIMC2001]WCL47561.1 glycosyltransferase family 2 protein [Leptospira sp. GIMC2001]
MKNKSNTLIVIPAYNEESTIREVVEGALEHADVCVVDDASKDSTPKILAEFSKKYPGKFFTKRHEKNTHIPGGVQDGMKIALEQNYDWVITMDAGMSHDPRELPLFLNAESEYELVIGRRGIIEGVPIYRKVISWLAARVMNYCLEPTLWKLFGPGIRDCTSGYRRYSKRIYSIIASTDLESVAFDFHMEALSIAISNKAKWKEIDITYVFSNSSFNSKVFKLAMKFAGKLLFRKLGFGNNKP